MSRSAPGERSLVGRDGELAAIEEFLGAAAPGALALEGEAGIGKTTLWSAGVEFGRATSAHVLACSPAGAEAGFSFSALADLLDDVAEAVLPRLPAPQRRALGVALLLEEPTGAPPPARSIGTGLLNVLRLLAASGPVLVAIDDVQWLDGPSLAALRFATRRLRDEPVRVLTARRSEGDASDPLELSQAFGDQATLLVIGPLTHAGLFELVRLRLGRKLPRPTLVRLHDSSGGNPFYALEIARGLAEHRIRHAADEPLPLPADLRDLVRQRLAGLPGETLHSLRAAAALREPSLGLLDAAGYGGLDAALRAGVIDVDGGRVRFDHPLVAAVCLADAPDAERRELHRRLARVVGDSEERARHLALAAEGPDGEVAAALDAAAREAAARGAPGTAAELGELAARLTPDRETASARRLATAEHLLTSGDPGAARALAEPLAEELPSGSDRARALLLLARATEDDMDRSRLLAQRALADASGDDRLRAEINDALAVTWIFKDVRKAVEHAQARLELVESFGAPAELVDALGELAFWETYTGWITPGVLERAQSLAATLDPSEAVVPTRAAGVRLLLAGRFAEARPLLEHVHRLTLERGDEFDLPSTLGHLRQLEVRAGNWRRAEGYAAEGLRVAEQLGLAQTEGAALHSVALLAALFGRVDRARAAAERGLALSQRAHDVWFVARHRAVLGFLELSLGDADAALGQLRELPDRFAGMGYGHPGTSEGLVDAIEAHATVGELDRARELISRLEADAARLELPWAAAAARRCEGLVAQAEEELERAIALLENAVLSHEGLELPLETARTLLALGVAQRRGRRKRAARESLEQALAIFDELGAGIWRRRTQEELRRIGGRGVSRAGLTATEQRIAELVSEGRTNRQTAEALHLSPKTVAWNLSKIYRKLGVRSRTELAARRHASSR